MTLYRVRRGEVCVLSASCLMDAITFDVFIEAMEETQVAVIPSRSLHKIMEQNPQVELFLCRHEGDEVSVAGGCGGAEPR